MDEQLRIRIDWIIFKLGLIVAAIGITGEVLGWRDAFGAWATGLGIAASVLSLLDVQGREAVRMLGPIATTLTSVDGKQDSMLGKQEAMLTKQDGTNERLDHLIEIIDERL